MATVTGPSQLGWERYEKDPLLLRLRPKGMPLLYEDEGMEMGESDLHTHTCDIALYGLEFHFAKRPRFRVFSNLNLYYSDAQPNAYVSPDGMVVEPPEPLPEEVTSYRIDEDRPAPHTVAEILSFRTWQEGDLSDKPVLYAELGISEYILVDVTGEMLPRKLLLLRRQENGWWAEEQDDDGGVTSQLGFRFIIDKDGHLRVLNARTGKPYARPGEAQNAIERLDRETKARRKAEERARAFEEELTRLRKKGRKRKGS